MALYVENDMRLACGGGWEGSQLVHYCQWWRSHSSRLAQVFLYINGFGTNSQELEQNWL